MWIINQISQSIREEYIANSKILDFKTDLHKLEIFKSNDFDQIALLNEKKIFLKKYNYIQSELLAYIPLCTHTNAKKILIHNRFDISIATEILKSFGECEIGFYQNDEEILKSFIDFFDGFCETLNSDRFKLINSLPQGKTYDIIISDDNLANIQGILKDDGIAITQLDHSLLEVEKIKPVLENLGQSFRMVMPFFAPMGVQNNICYVFASNKFHPLADIILQKADMLDGLKYYNAHIHNSAFRLPESLKIQLKNIAKN